MPCERHVIGLRDCDKILSVNRAVLIAVVAGGLATAAAVMLMRPAQPAPEEPPAATAPAAAPRVARGAPEAPRAVAPEPEPGEASPVEEAPVPEPAAPAVETPPTAGILRIDSDVPGARVFIDREFVGAAPVTAENVSPGTHQLNVSAEGFDGYVSSIEVAPGPRDIMVRLREVRLNLSVEVIHRHGIGSCSGRLVATPQGIRYETSHRDDAFTSPLLDLETFQVDYLAKNLRVKLPKGRQLNFTDPDGNADRLFVFHRDVEGVRERLRKGDRPATN